MNLPLLLRTLIIYTAQLAPTVMMPVMVKVGAYVAGATCPPPVAFNVAAVQVQTWPSGVAMTKEVALVTLTIGYQPGGSVPAVTPK